MEAVEAVEGLMAKLAADGDFQDDLRQPQVQVVRLVCWCAVCRSLRVSLCVCVLCMVGLAYAGLASSPPTSFFRPCCKAARWPQFLGPHVCVVCRAVHACRAIILWSCVR